MRLPEGLGFSVWAVFGSRDSRSGLCVTLRASKPWAPELTAGGPKTNACKRSAASEPTGRGSPTTPILPAQNSLSTVLKLP